MGGHLFSSEEDFDLYHSGEQGLWIFHGVAIDYSTISHFEYRADSRVAIAVQTDNSRLDLPTYISSPLDKRWELSDKLQMGQTKDGEIIATAEFPVSHVAAKNGANADSKDSTPQLRYEHIDNLFSSQDEFDFTYTDENAGLWIFHGIDVDYSTISHFEYYEDTRIAAAVRSDGSREAIAVPVNYSFCRWWEKSDSLSMGRTVDREIVESAGFSITHKNRARKVAAFHEEAEKGDAEAQAHLGRMYRDGSDVRPNPRMSHGWFLRAARQGHANAQFYVAQNYLDGNGVRESLPQAAHWARLSADQADPQGQFLMAYFYYRGYGVDRDPKRASALFRASALQGNQAAVKSLKTIDEHNRFWDAAERALIRFTLQKVIEEALKPAK